VLLSRLARPFHNLGRAPIGAHDVDGDGQPLGRHPRYSTMIAWRPPYHPQLGQTTCGSLPRRHCGQTLRGGAASDHAPARRLRLFIFEVFFLGTATSAPA
jgi:hypothetical protein